MALEEIQIRQRVWADTLGAAVGEDDLSRALELLERVTEALSRETVNPN